MLYTTYFKQIKHILMLSQWYIHARLILRIYVYSYLCMVMYGCVPFYSLILWVLSTHNTKSRALSVNDVNVVDVNVHTCCYCVLTSTYNIHICTRIIAKAKQYNTTATKRSHLTGVYTTQPSANETCPMANQLLNIDSQSK